MLLGERYSGINWLSHLLHLNAPQVQVVEPFNRHGLQIIEQGASIFRRINASDTLVLIVVKHPLAWAVTMRERAVEGLGRDLVRVTHHPRYRRSGGEKGRSARAMETTQRMSTGRYRKERPLMRRILTGLFDLHGTHRDGRHLEDFLKMPWVQNPVPSWRGHSQPPERFDSVLAMRTEKYRAILDALALYSIEGAAPEGRRTEELRYAVVRFEDLLDDSESAMARIFEKFNVGPLDGLGRPPWRSAHYWKERLPNEPEWHDLDEPHDHHQKMKKNNEAKSLPK